MVHKPTTITGGPHPVVCWRVWPPFPGNPEGRFPMLPTSSGCALWLVYMGGSINGGTPKWFVCSVIYNQNGWELGVPLFQETSVSWTVRCFDTRFFNADRIAWWCQEVFCIFSLLPYRIRRTLVPSISKHSVPKFSKPCFRKATFQPAWTNLDIQTSAPTHTHRHKQSAKHKHHQACNWG